MEKTSTRETMERSTTSRTRSLATSTRGEEASMGAEETLEEEEED